MENKKTHKTQAVPVALFAALIAAGCFIVIPIGIIPIVLQNMLAVLSGCILGGIQGAAAVGLFLAAGTLGLPVFSGGKGGIGVLTGPTGGFLAGYFIAALLAGSIAQKPKQGQKETGAAYILRIFAAALTGFAVMYIPGIYQFMQVTGSPFAEAAAACAVPFLPGDIIKLAAAVPIAVKLRPAAARYFPQQESKNP